MVAEKDLKPKIDAWRKMRCVRKRQRCRKILGFGREQGFGVSREPEEFLRSKTREKFSDVSNSRVSSPIHSLVQSKLRAKSRDHEILRAQKKVSKDRPKDASKIM